MTLDDGYKHQPVPGFRTLSSIETMFSLMERELRAEVGPGKVAWMSKRWRKSIFPQDKAHAQMKISTCA